MLDEAKKARIRELRRQGYPYAKVMEMEKVLSFITCAKTAMKKAVMDLRISFDGLWASTHFQTSKDSFGQLAYAQTWVTSMPYLAFITMWNEFKRNVRFCARRYR